MTHLILVSLLIFIVAVAMTMVGKGGGNFYVVILAIANIPMHEAATTGQFILFSASVAAMIIFQKKPMNSENILQKNLPKKKSKKKSKSIKK